MQRRKIIQIVVSTGVAGEWESPGNGELSSIDILYALCDDGTVWYTDMEGWKRHKPIPQDSDDENQGKQP